MSPIASSVMLGLTWHSRFEGATRHFTHKLFFLKVDLSELSQLSKQLKFFGYNRWAPFSIRDSDYLGPNSDSSNKNDITEKLRRLLELRGFNGGFKRAVLITTPRVFGMVFNPVNFYLCYNDQGDLYVLVGEVNNTFDESYAYVVEPVTKPDKTNLGKDLQGVGCPLSLAAKMSKVFFVSPFMDMQGGYEVSIADDTSCFECQVSLIKNCTLIPETLSFVAGLKGTARPCSDLELVKAFVKRPLTGWATLPLIYLHAVALTWFHKVPVCDKPELKDRAMCRFTRPRVLARLSERLRRFHYSGEGESRRDKL